MKKIILSLAIAIFLISGISYASFPVKKEEVKTESVSNESTSELTTSSDKVIKQLSKKEMKKALTPSPQKVDEDFIITLALFILLGAFAAHRWYKGKPAVWNILFILTGGGCGIWALIDLIHILTKKF